MPPSDIVLLTASMTPWHRPVQETPEEDAESVGGCSVLTADSFEVRCLPQSVLPARTMKPPSLPSTVYNSCTVTAHVGDFAMDRSLQSKVSSKLRLVAIVGEPLVDWILRSVACRMKVRPFPIDVKTVIADTVMCEPFYKQDPSALGTYTRKIPPAGRLKFSEQSGSTSDALRTFSASVMMEVWPNVEAMNSDPALDLYSHNAIKGVDYLEDLQYVKSCWTACTPEPQELPPPNYTRFINPVWSAFGVSQAVADFCTSNGPWHLICPPRYKEALPTTIGTSALRKSRPKLDQCLSLLFIHRQGLVPIPFTLRFAKTCPILM